MPSGVIYTYGNCQIKQIATYLRLLPDVNTRYPIIEYFYVLDDVAKLDESKLSKAEVFIYQHTSIEALRGTDDLKARSNSDFIVKTVLPKDCLVISIPSVYSSILFPNAMSTGEARIGFQEHVPPEIFPNYAFSRRLHHLLSVHTNPSVIVEQMCAENAYSSTELQKNEAQNYQNLRTREEKNQVDIPLAEYIRQHFRHKRLLLTTNHPTKYLFDYLLNEVLWRMRLPRSTIALDMEDGMLRLGRSPILPCVIKEFALDMTHPSYADQEIWVDNLMFPSYDAYVRYLATLVK